ncbi:MAG: hypothetical protein E7057_04590 [Lentisphaerae bacterium]|nr:hypothetical protein [Lentisphaerota bacterium]
MKKFLLIILSAVVVSSAFAGEFDSKGVISGWKFAPVQVGVGIFESANLFDSDSVALFSIGLLGIQQHSSTISVGGITELKNNYGIQVSAASLTDRNYGLMIGLLENCTDTNENYGMKIGLFNVSGKFKLVQFFGINFFDLMHIGIANLNAPLQVGFLNANAGGYHNRNICWQFGIFNAADHDSSFIFQLGLLNYNSKSYIPWLPLVNWNMGR